MGSIQVEEFLDQGKPNAEDFRPYTILGLAPDQTTPTGLKEEVLLLSWLIALLRTREGSQISYEWAYGNQPELTKRSLSLDKPKIGLETSVEEAATAIANYLATFAPIQKGAESHPTSLLLSTGSLSQTSEAKDEGAIHLEVRFDHPRLEIRSLWQTENVLPYTVTRHIETLVDVVKLCIANSHFLIQDFYLRPTEYDLDSIWGWNHLLPPTYKFCMHEMVTERAHKSPDKEAICSWDGSLTYAQVDRYSTLVASLLKELGVRLHDVLPVCFEKSRWTSVAVLAVMKSGATFVLMDPTLPLARLQNMAHQVGAKMMLSSRKQRDLSTLIMPDREPFVVESDTFADPSKLEPLRNLSPVPSSALMYMIFTSGSTGSPKGVKLSHETYTSSAIPRAKEVGYTENSRVLDFASYAFDVSIDSMLLTLGNGGCLCIPSDENRMNDINGVIRNMRVNYAGLTPSVGRILDPDVIASLEGFGLGGEAVSARDCTVWGKLARIIIGYGPCECTIGCTVNGDAATGRDYISIGKGNGAAIWITDPNDHESLVPVGAVGELLVEGPIVGQGYLNDPEKTAAAFIEDPKWLVTGHKSFSGRRGRLYKTGDLGKYDPDGSGGIVFVGRKDTQVKLRGQRVELGEIESQLRAKLPSDVSVIAEVIVPKESGGQPTLVAFVAVQSTKKQDIPDLQSQEFPEDLRKALSNADAEVAKVLPRYMVPTAYIPVNYMPVLISGKTDRKRLREFGTKVDLRQVDQGSSSNSNSFRELSEPEQRMRKAWGETLKRDPETIQPNDNFFALGGDSVMAMKLVSISRAHGMEITVANTFNNPILSEMASVVQVCNSEVRNKTPPFSMIAQTVDSATLEAAHACGTEPTAIEDIYPCTPTQESLFTFSLKAVVAYVAQRVSSIPPHIDLDSWKRAWEGVVAASPILRTRVAQLSEPGLQQVILKEGIPWKHSTDLGQYLEDDRNEKMELGQSLARYAIIESDDGKRHMVWTIHHVVYDGWSEPIVLQKVTNALKNQPIELQSQMREFVRYVHDTDQTSMQEFWRRELRGAVGPQFPRLPTRDYLPTPDGMVERQVELEMSAGSPFTMATLIRGAWSLVASQYTGSDDIVFGETVMGRDIVLPGVEGIIGPLIATVPVRVHVHRTSSVEAYLQSVQQAMLTRIPYQHMGMQNIRKVSHDAQHACETGTGLVIQPEPVFVGSELGFEVGDVVREALHFNPYPVMLGCGIRKGGFRICASFDTSLVEVAQMERILAQVETTCVQLSKDTSQRISEISCLPEAELNQIWRWNKTSPLSLDESGKPRADASLKQGSIYPPAVVPWVCDPRNPSRLSPIGCIGDLWLEGALLSGETVESPAWLVAGSSSFPGRAGKVQSTGDMVQLREDGTLVLFGRKENFVGVQGHAVDIADLEAHLKRQLPPTVIAAAAVPQAPWEEPELVIFVEEQSSEGNKVKLMSEPLGIEGSQTSISAVISIELALALKKLDKFIRDNLPAYMAPSTYIVVDHVPNKSEEIDHNLLNQIASKVPRQVFSRLREGFEEVWKNVSAQTKLTANESILQAAWANVLRIDPRRIDVDDNFFRLGGDSVLAMKLVSSLRAQAHSLSVADIFQHMRLGDAAKMLRVGEVPKKKEAYKPFSTLGSALDLETFLSETVQPKLSDSSWSIRDVCPVTDSQALDVRATVSAPRTSIQYTMLYFDKNIDGEKLLLACNNLVKTHDILRTVFIEHDSRFLQVVLETLEAPITKQQTDQDLEQYVAQLCTTDIESIFELGSPLLRFFHVENITDGQHSLVLRLSHAQYDGISLPRLLRDLETLYTGHTIENYEHFPSYISQIHDKTAEAKAITYWRNLLADSTLSILPGKSPHNPSDQGVFHSKQASTAAQPFEEITTASLLTAAWAVLLARRLRKTDIAFGSVTSGRILEHIDNTENIVGPTYQITPVRIPFQSTWTPTDLLHFVQSQSASSAAHDFLGFDRISKHCTQWPAEAYFDSMVHHQDHEDFDTMSFVGEECKVDIANPHGDAAYPVKVVSFVRGGRLHFGVVGSERDVPFVDEVLDQLVNTAEELVRGAREVLVLGS